MIFDRPEGRHHPVARLLASFLLVATLVLAFLGYPPKVSAQIVWQDPVGLPALASTAATGRAAPQPLTIEIDGTYPVAATTSPTLIWKSVPAGVAQATFKVVTLAATAPQVVWTSTVAVAADRIARARVPAGLLKQGRTYAWAAESAADKSVVHGPFNLTIDDQRAGTQPLQAFAGVDVAQGTGELVYTYQGPSVSTLAGPVGWTLVHRPTTPAEPGLPAGWNLALSGTTGWESIRLNADASMTLYSNAGGSVTYTKSGGNQWRPLVGRFNTAGQTTSLTQNGDGTFSATDGNRTVTVFSAPTAAEAGHPVKVWSLDAPTVQQAWANGRLQTLTDPVTSNQIMFAYGGQNECATTVDPGFIAAPNGDLCAVIDWTGATEMLEYVQTAAGPQIGRIASGIGLGRYAQADDIAWDGSGRISEIRSGSAATAIASGAVTGLGAQDKRVVTQVAYDTQGRVASITAPEGLISGSAQPAWLAKRASESYTYAPFTVTANGAVVKQVWLDPVSLHPTKLRNESGNVVTYAYDAMGNQTRVVDETSGTVTETKYNAQGRPIEQLGPTKGPLTSPTAPRTGTAYDQDENGKAWHGLAARYWDNAGFNGTPTSGTTGPVMPGGTAPVTGLSLNWASNPTGGTGDWAARLTGIYIAPAAGEYTFENTTAAKLWVNGNLCEATCKVTLAKDAAASLQIDVVSTAGAAAGVNALVTAPAAARAPIPTAQLRPNYGLATSTSVRDNANGVAQELVTKSIFDPVTTQLMATVAPSGARQTRTYEPFDPAKGQWGRSTSVTDASGKTTTSSYYALNATATDCAGAAIQQQGQFQSTTSPGGEVASQVGTPSGGTVKAVSGVTTVCGSKSADGTGLVSTTTGVGPEVSVSSSQFVNGNPLEVSTTTTTQGVSATERSKVDTNGNVWESIDAHGTKTLQRWNPLTGKVDQVVETTAKGETRTTDYTYAANGQVATVVVNGRTLLTNEYAANGTLVKTTLGNGAVQTFELDANNNSRLTKTVFPDGTITSESSVHSPSGRLLSRTLVGPTGTSTFEYFYNKDGRLVDTRLTGGIPTKATAWHNEYTGPDGQNGNRASKTWTNADGTTSTTAFTYGADNRLLTASEGRIKGDVAYDAAGRATKIGGVSLAYDAAGHLLSAAQGNRTYTFSDQGSKTTLTEVKDGQTKTITAISSGESLVLGSDGMIDAQSLGLVPGVTVILDKTGAPTRWVYDDALGNGTWTSKGDAAPTKTHLYAPGGEPISVERTSAPVSPVDLIVDGLGWMSGRGATTLRLATPLSVIGARIYTPDGGRWLQPDPDVNGSFNAYEYAIGDPINQVDPGGNASWGWLWGAVASVVVGVAIGALTFGIGVGGVAAYGYAALALQVGLGVVSGGVSGFVGELVTQVVNNGGFTNIDWASVGIATGIGAALGGLSAGISGASFKVLGPGKRLRLLNADTPLDASQLKNYSRMGGYKTLRAAYVDAFDEQPGLFKQMFTKKSWHYGGGKGAGRSAVSAGDDEVMALFNGLEPRLSVPARTASGNSIEMIDSFVTYNSTAKSAVQVRAQVPSPQASQQIQGNMFGQYQQQVANRASSGSLTNSTSSLQLDPHASAKYLDQLRKLQKQGVDIGGFADYLS